MIYMRESSLEGHTRTTIISGEKNKRLTLNGDLIFVTYYFVLFELISRAYILAIQKVDINSHYKLVFFVK